jgi:hypothetical protein
VPIVDREHSGGDPAIVLGGYGAGGFYDGNTIVRDLALTDFGRPDSQNRLAIKFSFSVHQESGQCDSWDVDIDGALDGERDELIALFDPRQRRDGFNDHMTPTLRFNGIAVPLQRP